jgi:hypothetical protein
VTAWTSLLTWARRRLLAPENKTGRAGLKRLLRQQLTGDGAAQRPPSPRKGRAAVHHGALARAVRTRLDFGDVSGAAQVVANDGSLVEPGLEALNVLKGKHPTGPPPPPSDAPAAPPPSISLEQLQEAIARTPAGGAAGPDGLRPCHLKQMLGPRAGAAREAAQTALLDFCNLCLAGSVPPPIRPLLFGASLVAFRKADGGLRPIAIGLAVRRLFSRVACAAVREQAASLLAPRQVGIGISSGAEAAVHAARRFLASAPSGSGLLKLDFANAFNAVSRAAVIDAVIHLLPQLERLVRCAYGAESTLLFGEHSIASACGVQQGDPLGPLLFSLAIRGISHDGVAEFAVWYLDDATVGGPASQVAAEACRIKGAAAGIGLQLNESKCEAVSSDPAFADAVRAVLPGCSAVHPDDCVLLGAAIGAKAVATSLTRRTSSLIAVSERLATIDRHDALTLLRISLGHPRAVYELRAGASFRDPRALDAYDASLRHTCEKALNISLDDRAWRQCSLPPRLGGIGIRAPSSLALPAFLSSVAATDQLASQVARGAPDPIVGDAHDTWRSLAGIDGPAGPPQASHSWQRPLDAAQHGRVLADLASPRDVARLHSVSTPESAAVFLGLPCSRDGTRLSDIELPVAISLRLGLPVATPGTCVCLEHSDELGDHALSCNRGVERHRRHAEVNSRIRELLDQAGFPAVLEPVGLTGQDSRRFDGVTVAAFERGRPMAWDATVTHTCAHSHLHASAVAARASAAAAESRKAVKYADLGGRFDFCPVGIESLGAFGPQALELAEALATRLQAQTGERGARARIFRKLGVAVQAGNARRIIELHSLAASRRSR